jgi:hypothetical protein
MWQLTTVNEEPGFNCYGQITTGEVLYVNNEPLPPR